MTRSLLLIFSLAFVTSSCTTTGARASDDPFAPSATSKQSASAKNYRIRFEAVCDSCVIRWQVDHIQGATEEEGMFSESQTVWLDPERPGTASMTVTPIPGYGPVRSARITVDGAVVAQARPESGPGSVPSPVGIEARVPPPDAGRIIAGDGSGGR